MNWLLTSIFYLLFTVHCPLFTVSSPLFAAAQWGMGWPGPGPVHVASGSFSPAYVRAGTGGTGSATATVTLSVTAGQFAVCGIVSSSVPTNTLTCSDTNSDTFHYPTSSGGQSTTDSDTYLDSGVAIGGLGWATMSTTNSSEAFSCTVTNTADYQDCAVMIFSGTPTSGWDVAVAGASNASTASYVSGTSSTTASASELAIGLFSANGSSTETVTGTSSWTCPTAATYEYGGMNVIACYKVLSATGTQKATATLGTAASGVGMVSTIK